MKQTLSTNDFNTLRLSNPKKIEGLYFSLRVSNQESFKLGVTVSKKIYKQAVKRNQLKRWIKEFIRLQNLTNMFMEVKVKKPLDSYQEVSKELSNLLQKN